MARRRHQEAAFRRGFIDEAQFERILGELPKCEYRDYLESVLAESRRERKQAAAQS
jgi:glucose-1-phosphate thymidylyltransferase